MQPTFTIQSKNLLLLLLLVPTFFNAQNFPVHIIEDNLIGAWTRVGDFNQDDVPDVLLQDGDTIWWYENNRPGWTRHLVDSLFKKSGFSTLDVVDIDQDGDLDVFQAPSDLGVTIAWNENRNNGQEWVRHIITEAIDYPGINESSFGDLDGDGDIDIVIPSTENFFIYWLEQVSADNWIVHEVDQLDGVYWSGVIDLNGDGKLDIAAGEFFNGNVNWYKNNLPNSTWISHPIDSMFGGGNAITKDMDADGDLDLLQAGSPGVIVYYENPSLNKVLIAENLPGVTTIAVADVDGDSDLDVTFGGVGFGIISDLGWVENLGDGAGWKVRIITESTDLQRVITGVADIDGDGDNDFLAYNFDPNTQLGDARWYEFLPLPDYLASVQPRKLSPYTMITPRQLDTFTWQYTISNEGRLPLSDISFNFSVFPEGAAPVYFNQKIDDLAYAESAQIEFSYLPQAIGKYEFSGAASSTQLGNNFFQTPLEVIEVNDSILAKDDGSSEGGLGFGFGNPAWYGYYGSAFDLRVPDTLTAITIYISAFSDFSGSINLTVTDFDSLGVPQDERFHSEEIFLSDYVISSTNPVLTYQLEEPVILEAGKYIFAAGQDTIQGIIGFAFDHDNILADGFWLVSPVAGGGYPWFNSTNREVLMIRPHFNPVSMTTSTRETSDITSYIKLYPNPFSDKTLLEFELKDHTSPVEITITDVLGRTLRSMNLETPNAGINQIPINLNAPAGVLVLTLKQGMGIKTIRILKQ